MLRGPQSLHKSKLRNQNHENTNILTTSEKNFLFHSCLLQYLRLKLYMD